MEHAGSSPGIQSLFEWVPVKVRRGIFRARQKGPSPQYLRSLRSGEAVTTWTLRRLGLTGSDLLETYAMPAAARLPALLDRLDQGARFRPAEA